MIEKSVELTHSYSIVESEENLKEVFAEA